MVTVWSIRPLLVGSTPTLFANCKHGNRNDPTPIVLANRVINWPTYGVAERWTKLAYAGGNSNPAFVLLAQLVRANRS